MCHQEQLQGQIRQSQVAVTVCNNKVEQKIFLIVAEMYLMKGLAAILSNHPSHLQQPLLSHLILTYYNVGSSIS